MLKMRWFFGALLVMLALAVPAAAYNNPQITGVTIDSATIDRGGQVTVQGHLYCTENDGVPFGFQINGQNSSIKQVVGKTKSVQGGLWGGGGGPGCTGLTDWQSGSSAFNGKFTSGWATVNVQIQGACDQDGCHAWGGTQRYLKIVNKG